MGRYNHSEDELWEALDVESGLTDEEREKIEKGASLYEHDPMDDKNTLYRPGEDVDFVQNIVIDMTLDDGSKISYELVGRIDLFDKIYVLLHPMGAKDRGELYAARVREEADGSAVFEEITDQKELQEVNAQFDRLMNDDPNAVDVENGGVHLDD